MSAHKTASICRAVAALLVLLLSSCSRAERGERGGPVTHDNAPTKRRRLEWPFHIAWGEPKDGLQLGLALEKSVYEANSPIRILVYVRNTGRQPLQVDIAKPELRWPVFYSPTGSDSARLRLHHPGTPHLPFLIEVPPGEEGIALIINTSTYAWRSAEKRAAQTSHMPNALVPGSYTMMVEYAPGEAESGSSQVTILPRKPLTDVEVAKVRSLAEKHWGNRAVCVTCVHSERLGWYLKGQSIYHTDIYNPQTVIAGPGSFRHTVVLRSGEPIYVSGDADAADLLGAQNHEAPDADTALDLALAFVELRGYRFHYDSPFHKRRDHEPPADAFQIATGETPAGWRVTLPLFQDNACRRCEITVSRQGQIQARAGDVIFSAGGYR